MSCGGRPNPRCDSDGSDAPGHRVAARAGPGQYSGAGLTRTGDSDASERAGEATDKEITSHTKIYLSIGPSTREHTHTVDANRGQGRARRWQRRDGLPCRQGCLDGRRRPVGPDAAPGPALDISVVRVFAHTIFYVLDNNVFHNI